MAAAGNTPIQLYHSNTAGVMPAAANLIIGELAINVADKRLFAKDSSNTLYILADGNIQANAAYAMANAAFNAANTATSGTAIDGYARVTANAAFDTANTKLDKTGGTITGSLNVNNDLVVSGNLIVAGNVTTVSANDLVINDSIIYLANNNTSNVLDIGLAANFTQGYYQHTGVIRDATDGTWKFFSNVVAEPTTTVNFTNAVYDPVKMGPIEAPSANIGGFNIYSHANAAYARANSSVLKSGDSMTGNLVISGSPSVNTTTGALLISSGGIGVQGNVNAGGIIIGDTIRSSSASVNAAVMILGDANLYNRFIRIRDNASAGFEIGQRSDLAITNANAPGGVALLKAGANKSFAISVNDGANFQDIASANFWIDNNGNTRITSTQASISNNTGALVVQGGIGVQGAIYSTGGSLIVNNGLATTGNSGTIYIGDGYISKTYGGSMQISGGAVASVMTATTNFDAPIGANTAPGYKFVGTTTGLYSPTYNVIAFTANTANAFFVTSPTLGVNYLQVEGNTVGNSPILSAQGATTNLDVVLKPKGSGRVTVRGSDSNIIRLESTSGPSAYYTEIYNNYDAANTFGIWTNGLYAFKVSSSNGTFLNAGNVGTHFRYRDVEQMKLDSNGVFTVGGTNLPQFKVTPTASAVNYVNMTGAIATDWPKIQASGTDATIGLNIESLGNAIRFNTTPGGGAGTQQFRISHTASAVNWVQVTGAVTSAAPIVIAQGSDTNIDLVLSSKGTGSVNMATANGVSFKVLDVGGTANNYIVAYGGNTTSVPTLGVQGIDSSAGLNYAVRGTSGFHSFYTNWPAGPAQQFRITHTTASVNNLEVRGGATGSGPNFSAAGSDSVIPITYTTKGNGSHNFNTGNGVSFRVYDNGSGTFVNLWAARGSTTSGAPVLWATGGDTNVNGTITSGGTGSLLFRTNDNTLTQFNVSHTANSVNYLNVTGASTTNRPALTAQGSDTDIGINMMTKGVGELVLGGNTREVFVVSPQTSSAANFLQVLNGPTGATPALKISNYSTDANVDFNLITKGTGAFNFITGATAATQVKIVDIAGANRYLHLQGGVNGVSSPAVGAMGGTSLNIFSSGGANIDFWTNGLGVNRTLSIAHTGSAVNYFQMAGGTAGNNAILSLQGSDASIFGTLQAKGSGGWDIVGNGTTQFKNNAGAFQFQIYPTVSSVNYIEATGAIAGASPRFTAKGSDTDIGIDLISKNSGSINLNTGNGTIAKASDNGVTSIVNYLQFAGASTGNEPTIGVGGSDTDVGFTFVSKGAKPLQFRTGSAAGFFSGSVPQFNIAHTANAVNYVQVTGASAGNGVQISSQGSDSTIRLNFNAKGSSGIDFNVGSNRQLFIGTSAGQNYFYLNGASSGSAPILKVDGADNDVGMSLLAKGNGAISITSQVLKVIEGPSIWNGNTEIQLLPWNDAAKVKRIQASNEDLLIFNGGNGTTTFFSGVAGSEVPQMQLLHTANSVNYVRVTGAATGASPIISAQGSDTSISFQLRSKGSGDINLMTSGGTNQVVIRNNSSAVNFISLSGSATGFAERIYAEGSDTNIPIAFQSKGTGAIDLAAGSSGVNISNGGTVTAITRTGYGSNYTSIPSVAITAPTTAGGVQATAAAVMELQAVSNVTIIGGGTGYTVNDTLTFVGGTGTPATVKVATVSGGVITGLSASTYGAYTVLPTAPISVTGGTGTGATFSVSAWDVISVSVTNAGSGYVEQPTVSFSGGGGSGAAAYATVGSTPTLKSIHTQLSVQTAGGEVSRFLSNQSGVANGRLDFSVDQFSRGIISGVNSLVLSSTGTGSISFQTNSTAQQQMVVTHTASAVNYVQVTGNATGGGPSISAQGSDSNISMYYIGKGIGGHVFTSGNGGNIQAVINNTTSAVNWTSLTGSITGSGVVYGAAGTDTNIDISLVPKGSGSVNTVANITSSMYVTTANTGSGYLARLNSGLYGQSGPRLELGQPNSPALFMTVGAYGGTNNIDNNTRDLRIGSSALSYIMLANNATGNVFFGSSTASISNSTGAITVTGGVGVTGNVYVGSGSVIGYSNTTSQSAVYQYYNQSTNSLDTVFA